MSWSTDWPNAVSEVVTEIQSIASNQATDETNISTLQTNVSSLQSSVNPLATSASSSLSSVTTSIVQGQFLKLYAYGLTNGGTDITLNLNGNGVFTFTTAFSGGSNQPFIMELTVLYDGSKLYIAPISPINTNDLKPAYVTVSGSPSSLTFSISGTSSVGSFVLKFA